MNLSREDLIILTAANIYAVTGLDSARSVQKALEIEQETIKQRKAQANAAAGERFNSKDYLQKFADQIPTGLCSVWGCNKQSVTGTMFCPKHTLGTST